MKVRLTEALRHPQRRTVWLLACATTVVVAAAACGIFMATAGDEPRTTTSTARVQRGTVTTTVSSAGTAQPLQSRVLSFSLSGTVTELSVKAGDTVAAGTVLARIDDAEASSAVSDAQKKVDNAKDAVERATASLSGSGNTATGNGNAATGTSSSACVGNAAYQLDASQLDASQLDASQLDASQLDASQLDASQTASQPPSATATTPVAPPSSAAPSGGSPGGRPTSDASCASTGNNNGTGGTGTGGGTGSAGGRDSGGGGSTTDSLLSAQQQLNNALRTREQKQAQLAGTAIIAPVAGKVLSVGGVIGSRATQSSSGFIVLAGTSDVAVKVQFTEAEVAKVTVGQAAKITLPNLAGQDFTGKVVQIDPAGTISSKLVRYAAIIAFDTIPTTVLYGQTANAAVVTASAADVLFVPSTAVKRKNGDGTATVLVRSGGRDERRNVTVGLRGDAFTEIRAGLVEGEEVLTVGR